MQLHNTFEDSTAQLGIPDIERQAAKLKKLRLALLVLVLPATVAAYFLGGLLRPGDAQQTLLYTVGSAVLVLAAFLSGLGIVRSAETSCRNTLRIHAALTEAVATHCGKNQETDPA